MTTVGMVRLTGSRPPWSTRRSSVSSPKCAAVVSPQKAGSISRSRTPPSEPRLKIVNTGRVRRSYAVMDRVSDIPIAEQIAWLQDRADDAELLRQCLVKSGSLNAGKAARDAAMWRAVLAILESAAMRVGGVASFSLPLWGELCC